MAMRVGRVQATIFLPESVASVVDELRQRWDPSGAWRIAPHITVLHRAQSAPALQARLDQIAPALSPFRLRIGQAERWPPPEIGIFIGVDDVDHGLRRLRNLLATASGHTPRPGYIPHVTITHPRRMRRKELDPAWAEVRDWGLDETITVDTVSIVESTSSAWETVASAHLGTH